MPNDVSPPGQLAVQPGPIDYAPLARDNERRDGTEWPRIGGMLLADRYAEQTLFIYELLQNAEDALRERSGWSGPRSIKFDLSESCLRVSHFGKPFDAPDVRGISGISESTKDLTADWSVWHRLQVRLRLHGQSGVALRGRGLRHRGLHSSGGGGPGET
jgi:hypothetical protein